MPAARVLSVAPGSPADQAGIAAGDELVTVNGEDLRDVIRYQLQSDDAHVELELRARGAGDDAMQDVVIDKQPGAPLGVELEHAVFDRVRTCDNHCPFCFIHQLPKGMRRSLYLKYDDFRLSFLYGNFTTLTRFTEADYERVVTERLGPLFVSIHATDPDLRTRLLRNRRGATSLRWLALLLEAGIEIHGQIVVCPGVNDGAAFDDTLLGILDRFPQLATVGVVPLGVSAHNREPDMRPHTQAEAEAVVDSVDQWQVRYAAALGRRLVYASDEYYLLADRPFPEAERYDDFAQHENGIGMARTFEAEVQAALNGVEVDGTGPKRGFFAWVDGAPAEGYRAPRADITFVERRRQPVRIITGELGERVLRPLMARLRTHADVPVDTLVVANDFFGGNIGVTGLLTGADVSAALAGAPGETRYLLPDVALSKGRFLDGMALDDLPRAVEVVPTDGASLVRALA
ncbi:MAG: Fe-S oxidoreductase [Actinomycetia bacterium]|nr:Fe-S oxidoreductase [Actinomycetes bacterium]